MTRVYRPLRHSVIWMLLLLAPAACGWAQKETSLPFDVSGTYLFLHEGEVLQINIQDEELSGYINAHGSGETDRELVLAFFIRQGSWDGHRLSFQTRVVHGVSYSFEGHVERGTAKSRNDEGYLVIVGTLKQTTTDDRFHPTTQQKEVMLRSGQEGLTGDWTQSGDSKADR